MAIEGTVVMTVDLLEDSNCVAWWLLRAICKWFLEGWAQKKVPCLVMLDVPQRCSLFFGIIIYDDGLEVQAENTFQHLPSTLFHFIRDVPICSCSAPPDCWADVSSGLRWART